jgi:hypothetical protein
MRGCHRAGDGQAKAQPVGVPGALIKPPERFEQGDRGLAGNLPAAVGDLDRPDAVQAPGLDPHPTARQVCAAPRCRPGALGATRRHAGAQFLTESLLLSLRGGIAGAAAGAAATAGYAAATGQAAVVPLDAVAGGIVVAISAGVLAGAYPAFRAARLAPADALRAS